MRVNPEVTSPVLLSGGTPSCKRRAEALLFRFPKEWRVGLEFHPAVTSEYKLVICRTNALGLTARVGHFCHKL